jgi:uncharacterized DUF497 family protein
MKIEWNEEKNRLNILVRGLDFADAHEIFEKPILISQDKRKDYGEDRFVGMGFIKGRVMVIVFTRRRPDIITYIPRI